MPILRTRHAVESPTGTFIVHALADSSDFGLLGEKSSQIWFISCFGLRKFDAASFIFGRSAKKPVTVQTQTNSNTIGMCG